MTSRRFHIKVVTQFPQSLSRRLASLCLLVTILAASLVNPAAAVDVIGTPHVLSQKFFDLLARGKAIQSNNSEKASIVWDVDGETYCSDTPPATITNGFTFQDAGRWDESATNPGPLSQGDPMVLTYSFLPDGTGGNGFTCFVDGESPGNSNLIAFLDGSHGAGPGGADLTQRPWFTIFRKAFENWGVLNGVEYVYEPNDDGAAAGNGGAVGVLGVRGDIRIGGHLVDGQVGSNVLACNYFPENGDMIIDTGNAAFFAPDGPENRGFRNVLEHEHGHGMGVSHVCPINQTKLMEPFISTAYLGAQEDDILAANRGYGDRYEFSTQNDTSITATAIGTIGVCASVKIRSGLSIDSNTDQYFYSFVAPAGTQVSVTMTPKGSTYLSGPQNVNGSCSAGANFNSLIENNLGFELRGHSGVNVLATANSVAAGGTEQISNIVLNEGAGTYFVRVFGAQTKAQMYDLTIDVNELPTPTPNLCVEDLCTVIPTTNGNLVSVCL